MNPRSSRYLQRFDLEENERYTKRGVIKKHDIDSCDHVGTFLPCLETSQKRWTTAKVVVVVILCLWTAVGGYFLAVYSTHGKPKYDPKYNIPIACIPAVDETITYYVTKQFQFERYPPEDPGELDAVLQKMEALVDFKKRYNAVKDELFNYDPDYVPVFIWMAFHLILNISGCVFTSNRTTRGTIAAFSTFLSLLWFIGFAEIIKARCPVKIPNKHHATPVFIPSSGRGR